MNLFLIASSFQIFFKPFHLTFLQPLEPNTKWNSGFNNYMPVKTVHKQAT